MTWFPALELDDDAEGDCSCLGGGGGESLANRSSNAVVVDVGADGVDGITWTGACSRGEFLTREVSLWGDSSSEAEKGDEPGLSYGMNSGSGDLLAEAEGACRIGDGGNEVFILRSCAFAVLGSGLSHQRCLFHHADTRTVRERDRQVGVPMPRCPA